MSGAVRRLYVAGMRGARSVCAATGFLEFLEVRRDRRFARWLRSLFAVHDIADLIHLDLPWWTLSAVDRVDAFLRDRPEAAVFEFGSGASTVWLARRARAVITVEHDAPWLEIVQPFTDNTDRINLLHRPAIAATGIPAAPSGRPGNEHLDFARYVAALGETGRRFDVIVIDGRARVACLEAAVRHLAPGGMIVFDNAGRQRYRAALDATDLTREDHRGLTACLPYPDQTTLLYADGEPTA